VSYRYYDYHRCTAAVEGTDHICHGANGVKISDISNCCYDPARDGPVNENAYAFCPSSLPEGGDYPTLDRNTTLHGNTCAAGVDCGPPADLSNIQPFYNSTASAAPAPVPAAPAPVPAPASTVVVTAPAAAAPPVYGAVPFNAAGLSNSALAAGAVGAAALAGLIAVIASDDDDDNATTTTTTQ